jgi:hypothetical protein
VLIYTYNNFQRARELSGIAVSLRHISQGLPRLFFLSFNAKNSFF